MDRQEIKERIADWFGYDGVDDVDWHSGCVMSGSKNWGGEPMWLTLGEVADLIEDIVDELE